MKPSFRHIKKDAPIWPEIAWHIKEGDAAFPGKGRPTVVITMASYIRIQREFAWHKVLCVEEAIITPDVSFINAVTTLMQLFTKFSDSAMKITHLYGKNFVFEEFDEDQRDEEERLREREHYLRNLKNEQDGEH